MTSDPRKAFRAHFLEWLRTQRPTEQADRLYYHLGDLRDACADVARLIEELPHSDPAEISGVLRKSLATLSGQLFDHIPQHTREIEADVIEWRDKLYSEAEDRGEL